MNPYYDVFLNEGLRAIQESYNSVAGSLIRLGLEKRFMTTYRNGKKKKHEGLSNLASDPMVVNIHKKPLLLVFDTDDNSKFIENEHLKHLQERFNGQLMRIKM